MAINHGRKNGKRHKKTKAASRNNRVRVNANLMHFTRPQDERAVKKLQDFMQHRNSLLQAKQDAERLPESYDDTPDKMLSPEDFTSMCYSRAQSPAEILMLKEDEFLDEGRMWDRRYEDYRNAFVNYARRRDEELVSLGGEGGVLEGRCA